MAVKWKLTLFGVKYITQFVFNFIQILKSLYKVQEVYVQYKCNGFFLILCKIT